MLVGGFRIKRLIRLAIRRRRDARTDCTGAGARDSTPVHEPLRARVPGERLVSRFVSPEPARQALLPLPSDTCPSVTAALDEALRLQALQMPGEHRIAKKRWVFFDTKKQLRKFERTSIERLQHLPLSARKTIARPWKLLEVSAQRRAEKCERLWLFPVDTTGIRRAECRPSGLRFLK